MGRSAVVVTLAFATAVLMSGCTPGTPSSEHSGSHGSSGSATPSAGSIPAAAAFTLPADCNAIASASTLTALFADIPSRPPGDLTRPAPTSATKKLTCSWFAGDTTGGDVIYYSAPAADGQAYISVMQANGFTCAAALGGTRCDKTTPNTQYPVDTVETTFTRDDVWIYISMTNVDATALLPDLVATAWA